MADDSGSLYDAIGHYVVPQLLYVAAKLELAEHLREGPLDLAGLVERTGADPDALARALRALADLGVLARTRAGHYRLAPDGEPLLRDHPRSRRAAILFAGDLQHHAWGSVMHAMQTGHSGFEHAFGRSLAEHLARDEAAMQLSEDVRATRNAGRNRAIAEALDLGRAQTIADVGGGTGELLAELLRDHPERRGVLIELPAVAARARARLTELSLGERVRVVAADARAPRSIEAEVGVLAEVVHCMNDADAIELLRSCPGRRVFVVERVLPPAGRASPSHLADLHMLVMFGGRERTRSEFARLFEAADLRLRRIVPTSSWVSILEATRRPAG